MIISAQKNLNSKILSHFSSFGKPQENVIDEYRKKIIKAGDKDHVTVDEQLQFIDEFSDFPLGKFILENRGTNGYWTDYMIEHQYNSRNSGLDHNGRPLKKLEKIFLDRFPLVVATQQRAIHFYSYLQNQVMENALMASLPCGLMRDLISLDFSSINNFKLFGIDLDLKSLEYAEDLSGKYNLSSHVSFYQSDAWTQPFENYFTALTSNGLSVYEPDDNKVIMLYQQLFKALKPGGILITSCITPSPDIDSDSEWNMDAVDHDALRLQNILYSDILSFNFKGLRSLKTTEKQLLKVGFLNFKMKWDEAKIFPTISVQKPFN